MINLIFFIRLLMINMSHNNEERLEQLVIQISELEEKNRILEDRVFHLDLELKNEKLKKDVKLEDIFENLELRFKEKNSLLNKENDTLKKINEDIKLQNKQLEQTLYEVSKEKDQYKNMVCTLERETELLIKYYLSKNNNQVPNSAQINPQYTLNIPTSNVPTAPMLENPVNIQVHSGIMSEESHKELNNKKSDCKLIDIE